MSEEFRSFEEFWPFYVRAHSKPLTRWAHFAGLAGSAACVAAFVKTRRPAWLLAGLVSGYGPAWVAHFFVEGNRPATWNHPLWSLMGDFKMVGMMLQGKMDAEVERVMREAEGNGASQSEQGSSDGMRAESHGADRPN